MKCSVTTHQPLSQCSKNMGIEGLALTQHLSTDIVLIPTTQASYSIHKLPVPAYHTSPWSAVAFYVNYLFAKPHKVTLSSDSELCMQHLIVQRFRGRGELLNKKSLCNPNWLRIHWGQCWPQSFSASQRAGLQECINTHSTTVFLFCFFIRGVETGFLHVALELTL